MEIRDELKNELKMTVYLFVGVFIVFQVVFYKTPVIQNFSAVLSLFFIFVLPGLFLTFCMRESFGFVERVVAGSLFAAAILGMATYYLGLWGLHIRISSWILPPALMLAGVCASIIKFKK